MTLQEEVGLGNTEIDELAIIAADFALKRGKGGARVGIPARAVQLDGSAQIQLVALAHDDVAERLELGGRGDRGVGQGELVVNAQQRLGRLAAFAEHAGRLGLLRENRLVDDGPLGRELLVDAHGLGMIAQRDGRLGFAE